MIKVRHVQTDTYWYLEFLPDASPVREFLLCPVGGGKMKVIRHSSLDSYEFVDEPAQSIGITPYIFQEGEDGYYDIKNASYLEEE